MKIITNTGGLAETNGYLLADEAAGRAAIIDAPQDTVEPLLEHARENGWTIDYLLLTHGHWDHVSDHKVVTDAFPQCQVLIHKMEEGRLEQPNGMGFELPYRIPPRRADAYLTDAQLLKVGAIELEALHTPGHAAGHVCFHAAREAVIFTGDLIMAGSVGRYDFPDSDKTTLLESLRRVLRLPGQTVILPGHGPATTVTNELGGNPFVRQWRLGPPAPKPV